jgi:dienelactone hydrolase
MDARGYAETGHGSLNDHPSDEMPLWALITGRFASTGYNEDSAGDARRRVAALFETHLKGAG